MPTFSSPLPQRVSYGLLALILCACGKEDDPKGGEASTGGTGDSTMTTADPSAGNVTSTAANTTGAPTSATATTAPTSAGTEGASSAGTDTSGASSATDGSNTDGTGTGGTDAMDGTGSTGSDTDSGSCSGLLDGDCFTKDGCDWHGDVALCLPDGVEVTCKLIDEEHCGPGRGCLWSTKDTCISDDESTCADLSQDNCQGYTGRGCAFDTDTDTCVDKCKGATKVQCAELQDCRFEDDACVRDRN